MAAREQ